MAAMRTALVVEDSPIQALSLMGLLENEGFKVLWALNGKAGVTMANVHLPDVIVMDIEMPEMNGLEACEELKTNFVTQDIPIIMLTAHVDPESIDTSVNLGAIDFIPKDVLSTPVLLDTLTHLRV